jgi:hypothetical protein
MIDSAINTKATVYTSPLAKEPCGLWLEIVRDD